MIFASFYERALINDGYDYSGDFMMRVKNENDESRNNNNSSDTDVPLKKRPTDKLSKFP